ncbi:hypothetical protein ACM71H_13900 [Pseudomonas aeruginosa]
MTIKKASLSKSRHLKVGYQLYESRHSDMKAVIATGNVVANHGKFPTCG